MAGVEIIHVDGRGIPLSNPDKIFFAARAETKRDLANYYVAVGQAALAGVRERPTVLKRYPEGAEGDFFFQKRVPAKRPEWLESVTITFPSGQHADELCPVDVAHIVWAVNLGCIDLNPWPVRRSDLDHPDELRIDLDPQPGVEFADVRRAALLVQELLAEHEIVGFPKTSGSRGIHVDARIEPRWSFSEVRRAALAIARELAARAPEHITAAWWKEERGTKVFVDYNQNARDRTVASAYSVRANREARVSTPISWDEVADVEPGDFTLATVPSLLATREDPRAHFDDVHYDITSLLDAAAKAEAAGEPDAPWPPFFKRDSSEAPRVAPSRRARKPKI